MGHTQKQVFGRRGIQLVALALSLQTQLPANAQTTLVPGNLPTSFKVALNGAADYRITVKLPPAPVAPTLQLAYTGRGNGSMGPSWALSGLSSITRCLKDGARGSIKFDPTDRFCLDGQRLVAVSGYYGANGTEYRTELETFSKILYTGGMFKVWTKAGLVMDFTVNADRKLSDSSQTPREWLASNVTDLRGRNYQVTYVNALPTQILYGGSGITPTTVQFNYAATTDAAPRRYVAGYLLPLTNQRLQSIAVSSGQTPVLISTLAINGLTQFNSRLTSVQNCDGSYTTCMPPIAFTYTNEPRRFSTTAVDWALPAAAAASPNPVLAQKKSFTYNDTTQYGTPSAPVSRTQTHTDLVDLNGDGLPDLYVTAYDPATNTVSPGKVFLNTGSGFSPTATDWPLPAGFKAQRDTVSGNTLVGLSDLNGDGLPDLFYTPGSIGTGTAQVYFNTGSGFSTTATNWSMPASYQEVGTSLGSPTKLVDVNGDGRPDYLYRTTIFGLPVNNVYINTGTSFSLLGPLPVSTNTIGVGTSTTDTTEYGTAAAPVTRINKTSALIDINGDGFADLVVSGAVYFSNGSTMNTSSTPWAFPSGISQVEIVANSQTVLMLIDVNGDGLPDLYRALKPRSFSDRSGEVFLNTGSGFATTSIPWALPTGVTGAIVEASNGTTQASLIDLDGDGLPDSYVSDGTNPAKVYLGSSAPIGRLASVSSQSLPALNLTYAKLTDTNVYTKDAGTNAAVYPAVDQAGGKTVISAVAVDNGLSGSNSTSYKYGGLKADPKTRGSLGFRWMSAKDGPTNVENYVEYRQDFPYIALPSKAELRRTGAGNAGVLKRTTNTWACQLPKTLVACTVANGNGYFPYLSASSEETWDLNGASFPAVSTAYTYGQSPQFGGATQVVVSTGDGFSKTTVNTYATPDTTTWVINRVSRTSVTSTKP